MEEKSQCTSIFLIYNWINRQNNRYNPGLVKSWILQLWSTAAETPGEAEHSQTIGDQRVNRQIKHQQQLKAVKHAETWKQTGLEKLEFVGKCVKLLRG